MFDHDTYDARLLVLLAVQATRKAHHHCLQPIVFGAQAGNRRIERRRNLSGIALAARSSSTAAPAARLRRTAPGRSAAFRSRCPGAAQAKTVSASVSGFRFSRVRGVAARSRMVSVEPRRADTHAQPEHQAPSPGSRPPARVPPSPVAVATTTSGSSSTPTGTVRSRPPGLPAVERSAPVLMYVWGSDSRSGWSRRCRCWRR